MNGCKFEIYSYFYQKHAVKIGLVITLLIPQFIAVFLVSAFIIFLNLSEKITKLNEAKIFKIKNVSLYPA